ncbi:RagB/SusD family nutrient uptake outer membrane protein [Chitinophaga niabensis]|uniref:RagB/SusD family nutrient uptake outer membrane protein n=1 Tax=Chitinophaga niabensis TaxID=536979 RepID=UPI0031B9C6A0
MKRISLIILVLMILSGSSCTRFLDTTPTDRLSPQTYYQNEKQLTASLIGVYDILGARNVYARHYTCRLGMEADEGFYNTDAVVTGPQVYNFSPSDTYVSGLWNELYIGINRANSLLANLNNNPQIDEAVRNRIKGEALFLRAYFYFLLVQQFGGVPLILAPTLTGDDVEIPRSSTKEVYEKVLEDMEEAETLVVPIQTLGFGGRVSQSAVRGVLARVCLYMAGYPLRDVTKYEKAAFWAKKVIDDAGAAHDLNIDYQQVFINYAQDKYDIKESIWEVEFWGNVSGAYDETGQIGAWIGITSTNTTIIGFAYGFLNTTAKLYKSYETQDLRRDVAIAPYKYTAAGGKTNHTYTKDADLYLRNVGKYRREWELVKPGSANSTPTNFPLLRFSDVLLMYAEAENEVHGAPTPAALDALNKVRARAKATLVNITDKNEFFDQIVDERSRELCFEGLRKPDLIRWGIFIPVMKNVAAEMSQHGATAFYALAYKNVNERHLLFPIPSKDLSLNTALVQNPNW